MRVSNAYRNQSILGKLKSITELSCLEFAVCVTGRRRDLTARHVTYAE